MIHVIVDRDWASFVIAVVGGASVGLVSAPIAEFLDLETEPLDYVRLLVVAGVPIGAIAAVASKTWLGLLALVLGFVAAGGVLGAVSFLGTRDVTDIVLHPVAATVTLGFLGVPVYAILGAADHPDRRQRNRTAPDGPNPERLQPGRIDYSGDARDPRLRSV
ncbi:MAG TPA: hypothetical protein VFN41_13450 [Candidatus Limnocylindrales bacterium]|nr:hypothetical protein [Candidatus Limnocylindrales bacterium]